MAKETGIKSWKELNFGIAITNPGNAAELKTGDFRRPSRVVECDEVLARHVQTASDERPGIRLE